MVKISHEEVLRLAKSSRIALPEAEVAKVMKDLEAVLDYAQCVVEILGDVAVESSKNVNVMRDDVVQPTDPQPLLRQAPEVDENYFVVLPILDK